MYRVLIKGKRTDEVFEDDEEEDVDFDEAEDVRAFQRRMNSKLSDTEKSNDKKDKKKIKVEKTHPDLAAITYLGTGKVKDFRPETSNAIPPDMMASYSETKTIKLIKTEETKELWRRHNTNHLR